MRVAIIGAGELGATLTRLCLRAGVPVLVEDVFPDKLRSLEARLAGELPAGQKIEFAPTIEDAVRNADIALDTVPDELESKLEIFCLLDRMAPPKTVICSPLRAVGINDLASCTYRADRCIGFRLQESAVTLVAGRETSSETLDTAEKLFISLGLAPQHEKDESR